MQTLSGQILKTKQSVITETSGLSCVVDQFLGGGGQGEVYKAIVNGKPMALKWYYKNTATLEQKTALETIIKRGPSTNRFLWPLELVYSQEIPGYGYIMPLREERYKGIVDLMKRKVEPTFKILITASMEVSHSFLQLHSKGLCYRDISFGNVFFDPNTGEVLICDNDNVAVDGEGSASVLGTPRFMAPEIVRGETKPNTQTDLFSLATLLFYMLMVSHPLEGKRESSIRCFDLPAMNKLYGTEPLFIFDPNDHSNRPVKGIHDNAIEYWNIYPQFIKDLFTKAFTDGIKDVRCRVRENEWRNALAILRDWIIYCPNCGSENFYDSDSMKKNDALKTLCWSCKGNVPLPYRLKIDKHVIMLNHDSKLFFHHVDPKKAFDFTSPCGEVTRHPSDPTIWGLKNCGVEKWVVTSKDGTIKEVNPGKSATLSPGIKINFGKVVGEVNS